MTEPLDELAALVADVRAVLEHARLRGAAGEDPDAPLPAAVEATAAHEPEPEPEPVPVPDRPPALSPIPEVSSAWARLASAAREAADERAAFGAEGLRRVREDLGDCRRCGLCAERTQIVFGVGDPEADLVVVGEGPGFNEDRQGEPFVGEAGQMLDRMLANVLGLPRPQVYICNVVKCRPPKNRNPLPDEVASCLPFLHRQILAVRPRVILVLGGVAFKALFGADQGIKRARGKWQSWEGIPTLPTLHPAYLLRQPDDKALVFQDLKALRARYDELGGRRSA